MDQKLALSLKLELVWWIFTGILTAGILFPIFQKIDNYPFLMMNGVFIIVFVTFTRYIFLLKYTFLAHRQYFKMALIALSIPLIFYLVNEMFAFQAYLGEEGLETFMPQLAYESQESLGKYIRNEMVLFGVGSIITAAILPIRMIVSIWRGLNRGTV